MNKIKTAVLIVNWIIIIGSVVAILLMQSEVITTIEGVDGPTEIILQDETPHIEMIPPIILAVVLLLNSFVITQQNRIIANQRVDPTVKTPVE